MCSLTYLLSFEWFTVHFYTFTQLMLTFLFFLLMVLQFIQFEDDDNRCYLELKYSFEIKKAAR